MIPWEWGSIYSGISPFGNSPCVSSKILPATSSRLPPFKELHRCFCCVTTWLVWAAKHWFQPTVPLPLVVRWIVFFGIWLQQISTSFITRNRAKPISFQVWTQQLGPPTSTYNMHPCGMLPCRWLACLVASWKPKTGCQHPFSSWLSAHESYMKIHEVTVPWGMPSSGWHPCTETAASRLFGAFRSHRSPMNGCDGMFICPKWWASLASSKCSLAFVFGIADMEAPKQAEEVSGSGTEGLVQEIACHLHTSKPHQLLLEWLQRLFRRAHGEGIWWKFS